MNLAGRPALIAIDALPILQMELHLPDTLCNRIPLLIQQKNHDGNQ